jgi:pimeloyl-ACP methyl ester carboxylesterase
VRAIFGVLLATFWWGAAVPRAHAHERLVEVAPGETLRVTVAGSGAPVVLLPGWFASAFGFRALSEHLSASGHRPIVVEPLGYGGSARPERANYSLTAQADRVARVLDALGVQRAALVAHAGSVSIALRLAYRHPERVLAVVAIEGGPSEAAATTGLRRALRFAPLIKLFGGMRQIRGRIKKSLVEESADPAWVTAAVVEGYMAPLGGDIDTVLDGLRGMARSPEPERLEPNLGRVRCPVRLVLGAEKHDAGPKPEELATLTARIADFAIDRVPGAAHYVHEERPAAVVRSLETALLASSR